MAEHPAMPLWTDAYLSDTIHFSTIEHGAYLLLLMCMWRNGGSLPNDDAKLAKFARLTSTQWKRIKPTVIECFQIDSGRLVQRRLTKEFAFVRRQRQLQSDRSKAKSLKSNEPSSPAGQPEVPSGLPPTPTPIKEEEATLLPRKEQAHPLPEPWEPDADLMAFAKSEVGLPMATIMWENGKFIDYWRGKATVAAGRKSDWPATWRNWMRKASENKESLNGANRKPSGRRTVHDTFADLEGDIAAGFAEGNT